MRNRCESCQTQWESALQSGRDAQRLTRPLWVQVLCEEPPTGEALQTGSWKWQEASGGRSEQEENGNLSIPLKMHIDRLPEKDSRLSAGLHPALTQAVLTSCGCVTALHPPQDTLPLHPLGSAELTLWLISLAMLWLRVCVCVYMCSLKMRASVFMLQPTASLFLRTYLIRVMKLELLRSSCGNAPKTSTTAPPSEYLWEQ